MYAPVTHILPLTTIWRERLLPVPGVVKVRVDQRVAASDVVAQTYLAQEHLFVDVARKLGLSADAADRLIRCKVNDELEVNTVIASRAGLFHRELRSPRAGRVVVVGGGRVLLEVGESKLELRAGVPGQVMKIIPGQGVAIQTTGALIQGLWGNGRIETGILINLMENPGSVIVAGRLDVSLRGSILLAGMLRDEDVLYAAAGLPVRGLILSSMLPSLASLALQMRYPILAMDGLGSRPMNSAAYRLLTTNLKRETTVNAELYDRYSGGRPEVIIPLPVTVEPAAPNAIETFDTGQRVLLRASPYYRSMGVILRRRPGLTTLPSGLRAPAADVRLENNEEILVPLANLEVVG